MKITSIESRVYRLPLDPPFVAAWDPVPRTEQEATVVLVRGRGYEPSDELKKELQDHV